MFLVAVGGVDDMVYDPRTGEVFTVIERIEIAESWAEVTRGHCHVKAGKEGPKDTDTWPLGYACQADEPFA